MKKRKVSPGSYYDFVAYTDGGYNIGRNVGAAACVILTPDEKHILYIWAKAIRKSTNNREELGAIIHTVMSIPDNSRILIHSDSEYSIGVLSRNMRGKKNPDLLKIFWDIVQEKNLTVDFRWVRGHSGVKYNEMVDSLCTETASLLLKENIGTRQSRNYCADYLETKNFWEGA